MKQLIYILTVLSIVSPVLAQNVSAFKVDAVTEQSANGETIRKIKLILVKNIRGEKRESFELTVSGRKYDPHQIVPSMWHPKPGPSWLSGSLVGETVIVGYGNSIEMPNILLVGEDYLDDVEFYLTFPKDLNLALRKQKLDQYLATHRKIMYAPIAGPIAGVIIDSGYSEEVWSAYVRGNPLGLKDAPHQALFDGLSVMMFDDLDENRKSTIPESVRKPRINLWVSEFASQIGGNNYTDKGARNDSVRLLAILYKKFAALVTPATQAELDKLLSSDVLTTEQKKLFK